VDTGHEVHIITGKRKKDGVEKELEQSGAVYTKLFSITDYHESIGTTVRNDEHGRPHMESYLWDRTKADYCEREGIDLHFDDSPSYGQHFKSSTIYARIGQRL